MSYDTPNTILIMDDEAAIRESFTDYLEDMDFRVLCAENGRVGIDVFERESVDLVLVDLRMPEMDGLDVLSRLSEVSPDTPLIVVSGTGVIGDAVEALRRGAWDYLLKPVEDFSVLMHAVKNGLEKARLKKQNRTYQQDLELKVAERTAALEQANKHLSRLNKRLRRIVETTRSLAFCSEVDQFGSLLLEAFAAHMVAADGCLYLKQKEGLRLAHALLPFSPPAFITSPFAQGSVLEKVAFRKEPVLIKNLAGDTDLSHFIGEEGARGSGLFFPLLDEDNDMTGVLILRSQPQLDFMEQDKEIGTILASFSCEALRAVRATERLRHSEQQMRAILDNIRTGIIIVDVDTMTTVYANPTAAEMISVPVQDIIGRSCRAFFCSEKQDKCPGLGNGRASHTAESIFKTAEGNPLPVLKTVSRTTFNRKTCLLESFIDLTAIKQTAAEKEALENQLRQVQKMEALGTLAGGIAHDFNNILSAIIGYCELGFLDLNDPDHPLYDKFRSIYHAGNRAKDLVAQILAFSRMQEHLHTPVKISTVLREATKLLQASLPADITLESRISSEDRVLADPTQIHQVIMNLCTNAYHAMEASGGVLSVSLRSVLHTPQSDASVEDLTPGNYLELSVSDTGCGIKPSVMERIFDPYFTTKGKDKGTGLGLALVHGIVGSHGGTISVDSHPGKGTTFLVLLPVTEESTDTDAPQQTSLPKGTENVLFVDDEKDLVVIGRQMLEFLGYKVTGVVGSPEALQIFEQNPQAFDVVITDLNMPGLTGDRLAKKLISIRPDLPIILSTGFSERIDRKRASALGIRGFMMKPLLVDVLAKTLRSVLDDDR